MQTPNEEFDDATDSFAPTVPDELALAKPLWCEEERRKPRKYRIKAVALGVWWAIVAVLAGMGCYGAFTGQVTFWTPW